MGAVKTAAPVGHARRGANWGTASRSGRLECHERSELLAARKPCCDIGRAGDLRCGVGFAHASVCNPEPRNPEPRNNGCAVMG